jgi:hypothetical protein
MCVIGHVLSRAGINAQELYVMADERAQMNPKTDVGVNGLGSAPELASKLTPSSLFYPNMKSTLWQKPSSLATEQLTGLFG